MQASKQASRAQNELAQDSMGIQTSRTRQQQCETEHNCDLTIGRCKTMRDQRKLQLCDDLEAQGGMGV